MKTQHNTLASRISRLASFISGVASVRALPSLALAAVVGATALPALADTVACTNCITFSADKAFGIRMVKGPGKGTSLPPTVTLEYSTDQVNWQKFEADTGYAAGADNRLYLRGTNNTMFAVSSDNKYGNVFTNTSDSVATAIACSGNIETLLDYKTVAAGNHPTMGAKFALSCLFRGFKALTTAPELPATNLANYCYNGMFRDCTSLTAAPELPATTLADACYGGMFRNCTSLTTAPELPATTLASCCYQQMFLYCTSLTEIPALNVAVVSNSCCQLMFKGCSNLVVNTEGPGVEWCIPSDVVVPSTADPTSKNFYWAKEMFADTPGTIANSSVVTPGETYYVLEVTCTRTELKPGESTNLVAGVYTAAPAPDKKGGSFNVGENATLTGTNVTFAGNSAEYGGAILNNGVATLTQATFKDNVAQGYGGAINNGGVLNLNEVAFENNTAIYGGAIFNGESGAVNLLGPVSLATTNDIVFNIGLMNWDLTGEPTGVLNGYENLVNKFNTYTGALQITIDDAIQAPTNFVIATGNFSNIDNKKTFAITNSVLGGRAATVEINGGRVISGGSIYELTTEEDLGATPPTTNLVFTVIKPDVSKVIVNSNLAGKYKPGDEIEIEGETYYYGVNALAEIPHDGSLANTEILEIAGGSASITNEVTLKEGAQLVLKDGAALSIMGDNAILKSLADTSSISGNGAIYLDKGLTDDQRKAYTDKLADGSAIIVARASVDDKTVKETAKVEEGGKTYYNVITSDQPRSEETDNTVVTSAIVVDGAGETDGLLLKTNDEKPLVVAGSVTTTAPNQSLKLVKEQAADLTVNGKVSGFETISVENKTEAGKMVTTSTLTANKNITITNDGHLEAKALAGGNIDINNTSANTIIGEYSGQYVAITNTATGVAQDITLQAYGKNGSAGYVRLFGAAGCIYSNVTLVAGNNATPSDLSFNDGKGTIQAFDGINTLSGTVLMRGNQVSGGSGGSLRFENADVTCSAPNVTANIAIAGECNIASNDNGTTTFAGNLTLKDGAVLGGKTRICPNGGFAMEGTATLKDGAEVYNEQESFVLSSGATLKLRGSKFVGVVSNSGGTLDVYAGRNYLAALGNSGAGTLNLKGGEFITSLFMNFGVINWDLTEGTTTLDWAKVTDDGGSYFATVGNVASGTSYLLATNAAAFAETITVTNSVAGGAAATVKVGGVCKAGGKYWALSVLNGELKLAAFDPVKLSDVALIDKSTEPWKTNATAVVKFGDQTVEPEADGSFEVPANYPLDVVYEAANYGEEDGMMFGPGLKNKTIVIEEGIAGDSPMPADMKAQVASQCQTQWVDGDGEEGGREFAIDTRERIVVESPNDVLPIAYSTNAWGAVESSGTVTLKAYDPNQIMKTLVDETTENGYAECLPELGAYGRYTIQQHWKKIGGGNVYSNAYIYYSQPYALSWNMPHGTVTVTASGKSVAPGGEVLAWDIVHAVATPDEGYCLSRKWSVTNAVDGTIKTEGDLRFGMTFEMPTNDTVIAAEFIKATGATVNGEDLALGYGDGWEYDTAAGQLTLTGNATNRVDLSGTMPTGVKVVANFDASAQTEYIAINNFTNDVSDCDGVCAFAINAAMKVGVYMHGHNLLASGKDAPAIRKTGDGTAWIEFESGTEPGFLDARPGVDATTGALMPGIAVEGGEVQIWGGTYTSTVDPALVPVFGYYGQAAFDNGDGTWSAKGGVKVTYWIGNPVATSIVVTNVLTELLPVPAVPAADGCVFKGWKRPDGKYWDFAADVPDEFLGAGVFMLSLTNDFEAIGPTTPTAKVIPAGETEPVVVETFEKALNLAPNGGEITVSNTNPVETVEKPLIIKKGDGANLDNITPAEGLDKKVGDDGTVYIGEKTNGVVVVENEAGTEDPTMVGVSVQNACNIVDPAIIDAATQTSEVQSADALVASVKINVKQTGGDDYTKIVDLEPVLTLKTLTNGVEKATIRVSTNDFALSGAPMTVTIPCGDIRPVAVIHTHEGSFTTIKSATEEEGGFTYDAVGKTVSIAITNFSEITVLGAETTEYLNGSQSGSKAAGAFVATDVTVEKEALALTATKSILFGGTTTLKGPLTLNVDHEGAITNNGTFVWNLKENNTKARISPFGKVVQGENAKFQLCIDENQAGENDFTNEYVIAENVALAQGRTFALNCETPAVATNLVVDGEKVVVGKKMYSIYVNAENQLVFKVALALLPVTFQATPCGATLSVGNSVKAGKAQVGETVMAQAPMTCRGYRFVKWQVTPEIELTVATNDAKTVATVSFAMPPEKTSVTAVYELPATAKDPAFAALNAAAAAACETINGLAKLDAGEKAGYATSIDAARTTASNAVAAAAFQRAVDEALVAGKAAIQTIVNNATLYAATKGTDATNKVARLDGPVCFAAYDAWCTANGKDRTAMLKTPGTIFMAAFGQTNILTETEITEAFVITQIASVASSAGTQWRIKVAVLADKLPYTCTGHDELAPQQACLVHVASAALQAVAFGVQGTTNLIDKVGFSPLASETERVVDGDQAKEVWLLVDPPTDAQGKTPSQYFFEAVVY